MKRFLLLVGFVVFWKQWEIVRTLTSPGFTREEADIVKELRYFDTLQDSRDFVSRHKKDERYTDMHIFRIGEEVQP